MISLVRCLLVLALACAASAAGAADVVFPLGSRVGLAPPPGLTPSTNFYGFEDRANNVAMIMVPLPPDAYAELERTVSPDGLKKQGLALESREDMTLATGKAFLVIGRQEIEKIWVRKLILVASLPMATVLVTTQIPEAAKSGYPDAVIRTALQSLTARAAVPVEEQLAMVPFKVSEMAGFRVAGVIPGRAIMLGDAAEETPGATPAPGRGVEPHIFVDAGARRTGPDRRPRSFRPGCLRQRAESQGRPHHRIGIDADQQPAGPPDHRHRGRPRDRRRIVDCAMAAVRRGRLSAVGRGGPHRCLA